MSDSPSLLENVTVAVVGLGTIVMLSFAAVEILDEMTGPICRAARWCGRQLRGLWLLAQLRCFRCGSYEHIRRCSESDDDFPHATVIRRK